MTDPVKVLYVEDDKPQADFLKMVLEKDKPLLVSTVGKLWDAFDLVSKEQFDVILLDRHLPDALPSETVPRMIAQAANIPVIVISGHLEVEAMKRRALLDGAVDYIDKSPGFGSPEKLHHLVEKINNAAILGRRRRAVLERIDNEFKSVKERLDRVEEIAAELRAMRAHGGV